jgi:hypothetical protein
MESAKECPVGFYLCCIVLGKQILVQHIAGNWVI